MEKISYGIIGTGFNGCNRIRRLKEFFAGEVQIVAVADINEGNLEAGAQLAGGEVRKFTDYHELLETDDIDAVAVSTTNNTHKEIAVAALEAGKHVFCEKPMATTLADCDAMIEASKKAGRLLQVGLELRYARLYRKMKELISAGEIGTVHMMWCKEFRGPFVCKWRYNQQISGGALVEKNCHHFDLFNWMIGSNPVKVCAFGGQNVLKSGFEIVVGERGKEGLAKSKEILEYSEILDNAWVINEYQNGARAQLGVCFFNGSAARTLEIGAIGDKGRLECHSYENRIMSWSNKESEIREYRIQETVRGHKGNIAQQRAFIDSIRNGTPVFADGEVGKASILIPLAAQRSIEENRIVYIHELLS